MYRRTWEEVPGFYMWAHYDRIHAMVMRAVQEKIACEILVDRPAAIKASDVWDRVKWFLHIPSGQIWELVRPEDDVRSGTSGYFCRRETKPFFQVRRTPEPAWYQRRTLGDAFVPFWRDGRDWEDDVIPGADEADFTAWLNEQFRAGTAREYPVPEAVVARSSPLERWIMHVPSGVTWELSMTEDGRPSYIRLLELPPSLAQYMPRRD